MKILQMFWKKHIRKLAKIRQKDDDLPLKFWVSLSNEDEHNQVIVNLKYLILIKKIPELKIRHFSYIERLIHIYNFITPTKNKKRINIQ